MFQVPWNVYAFVDFAKFTGCLVRLQDRNANYVDTPSSASNMYGCTTTRQDPEQLPPPPCTTTVARSLTGESKDPKYHDTDDLNIYGNVYNYFHYDPRVPLPSPRSRVPLPSPWTDSTTTSTTVARTTTSTMTRVPLLPLHRSELELL